MSRCVHEESRATITAWQTEAASSDQRQAMRKALPAAAYGNCCRGTARLMVFKLVVAAAKIWRRLKGENHLPEVVQGVTLHDSVAATGTSTQNAV